MRLVFAILPFVMIVGCGIGLYRTNDYYPSHRLMTNFNPADADIQVDILKSLTFVAPADLDTATMTPNTIQITSGGTPISGKFSYEGIARVVTFKPDSPLPQGSIVRLSINTELRYNDALAATPQTISFTTINLAQLVAWWKFDGDGIDSSGHGNNLTLSNTTFNNTTQYQGTNSIVFNGTNAYGMTNSAINLGSQFTITVWIKLSDPVQASCNGIFTNINGGLATNGFKVFVNRYGTSDLTINTEAGDGTVGATMSTQNNFVTLGDWKQVAFVIDKTAPSASRTLFYFNGQPANQYLSDTSLMSTFPNSFQTNAQVYVGAFKTPHLFFKGEMDDMRVFNGVLSANDILQISQQH